MWLRNKLYHLAFEGDEDLDKATVDYFRAQLPKCLAVAGDQKKDKDVDTGMSSSSRQQKRQSDGTKSTQAKRKRPNLAEIMPAGMMSPNVAADR